MPRNTGSSTTRSVAWRIPLVVGATFVTMWLTFRLFHPATNGGEIVYPVWPASGVNMGLLWIFGVVCWPGVAIGSFLSNLVQYWGTPDQWRLALLAPVGDTLEAVIGVWLVRRAVASRHPLSSLGGATRFVLLAGIVATGLGAFIGIGLLEVDHQFNAPGPVSHGVRWFVSTSLAVLVIVPFMMLWMDRWRGQWSRRRVIDAVMIGSLLGLLQGWLFFREHDRGWIPPEPMVLLSLPLVFWAGTRFATLGAAATVLFASATAIVGTRLGLGPFDGYDDQQALTVLQMYLAVLAIVGVIVGAVAREREEARRSLEHRADFDRLLFDELNHRVRNTLASLLSILDLGKMNASSVDEYASIVAGRIHAMARVHDLLTDRRWKPVSLREVIAGAFSGTPTSRIEIQGPQVMLAPAQATAMGMILYELLANARKHGALAVPEGRVRVSWTDEVDSRGARHLRWEWIETCPVHPAADWRPGDGLRLIDGLARSDLRGHAELNITAAGAHHRFDTLLEPALQEPARAG